MVKLHFDIHWGFCPFFHLDRKLDLAARDILSRVERIGRVGRIGFLGIHLARSIGEIQCVDVFLAGFPVRAYGHGGPVVFTHLGGIDLPPVLGRMLTFTAR